MAVDADAVLAYLRGLQDRICSAVEQADGGAKFSSDRWERAEGGGGESRVLRNGSVFEQAGVNFSHVTGSRLPPSATAQRPELADAQWMATGVSLVFHPWNPYIPTTHANVRFFSATPVLGSKAAEALSTRPAKGATFSGHVLGSKAAEALSTRPAKGATFSGLSNGAPANGAPGAWWFGGGFDLTPYYPFEEDVLHWHRTAQQACAGFGEDVYSKHKDWCDRYFFLKHRNETRGVGGLFFDDLNEWGFEQCFAYQRSVGEHFLEAYLPIVARRKDHPHGERERQFQLYRRGRYVEFNLVYDRGTSFGLQSGGRTESILMSLPPLVRWEYNWTPEAGSPEARLYSDFLKPRDWLRELK